MATRRPASSRSRTTPMPPPPTRSRSVLAKTTPTPASAESSSRPVDTAPPARSQKEAAGTNIQVVIRCRGRSAREVQEKSPIIVTCAGAKAKEVNIEPGTSQTSLGVATSLSRTYPFDLVFGPEADQAMVYHDVVSPMLEQVIQGYNCTLFAYGQTGTGKTYTMQGDLTPTPMGNPSAQAGMIPRVLFRLFHQLESTGVDFSVKISFVELYNEELRDLLATEFTAPNGSVQPMGHGSKDKGDNGLKMFDESGKRGVFIQGLEEVSVTTSKAALDLLLKGSERRQIASTNFNEHSSRSHSVFTITVHTKDVSSFGEDLLKIGKLNLVDLAGSENIGRSGAENKRAREAGMINQSLLTLGRVINALVDNASHVPYRESKLTRLLQDSLGGRTKTCIIATVSPSRSNVEETLSTLDYALRAKSIRNKPEVNQRMTRNSLLKEYVAEIDRLKADLLATREKNGIWIPEDRAKEEEAEKELRRTELLEAKKQADIIESQLRSVREEFEQSIGLLMKRDGELKQTKERLEETTVNLQEKERHLEKTTRALRDEEVVRQVYQDSERNLDGVATSLKSTLVESTHHIEGLHAKLDRKAGALQSNTRVVSQHGTQLASSSKNISASVEDYIRAATELQLAIESQAQEFTSSQSQTITQATSQMDDRFKTLRQQFQDLRNNNEAESELFDGLQKALEQAHGNFEDELNNWADEVQEIVQKSCGDASATVAQQTASIGKAVDVLQAALDNIVGQAVQFVEEQRTLVAEIKEYSNSQAAAEIARLKKQNQLLSQLVVDERNKATAAKDDLVHRVTGLLDSFLQERDESLKNAAKEVQRENDGYASSRKAEQAKHSRTYEAADTRIESFNGIVEKGRRDNKRKREEVTNTIERASHAISNSLNLLKSVVHENAEASSSTLRQVYDESQNTYSNGLQEHSRIKRVRLETTTSMDGNVEAAKSYVESVFASTSSSIDAFSEGVLTNMAELQDLTADHGDSAMQGLSSVQETLTTLMDKGTREDTPTGSTPQKRSWKYTDHWQLAKSREEILGNICEDEAEVESPAAREDSPVPSGSEPVPFPTPTSTSHSDIENRIPRVSLRDEPPPQSALPRPSKRSMASPPLAKLKTEEKEVPLIESRRRNVSNRFRRQ